MMVNESEHNKKVMISFDDDEGSYGDVQEVADNSQSDQSMEDEDGQQELEEVKNQQIEGAKRVGLTNPSAGFSEVNHTQELDLKSRNSMVIRPLNLN